ncbi:phage tail protein [Lysinibacillus sp. CTST325]
MAIRSGFFNSVNGDRRYDAKFFAEYFASFIGDGVFPNPSNGLQLVEGLGMQTVLKAGKGWIKGYYVVNDSDYIFKHDIADGVLKRIDRIVMRLNHLTRQIEVVLKKGSQASSPTAPAIQRDAEAYELVLADVLINAGTTQINQGLITDQRLNKSLCGIAHGVVDQVDTTSIFNQYQSWFNSFSITKANEFTKWQTDVTTALEAWIDAQEKDFIDWRRAEEALFLAWFETVKGALSEDAAGNLFNMIEDHKNDALPHKFLDTTDNKKYKYGFKTNQAKDGLIFVYEEVK